MAQPGVFSPQIRRWQSASDGSPAVSVVMTCYNDRRFLVEAVEAVLAQTFGDFEFIIVDNGSDDPIGLRSLVDRDPRIRMHRVETNAGPGAGGDAGIRLSSAGIIARMDADDMAEPGWLAAVVEALDADPELALVGCCVRLINERGHDLGIDCTPAEDFAIRFTMLSHNPFYHPGIAYRRKLYETVAGATTAHFQTHDHRLWYAMLPHCRARNIAEPLVRYRYNSQGVTGAETQSERRIRTQDIRRSLWAELGCDYSLSELALADEVDAFLRRQPCRRPNLWPRVSAAVESMIAATDRQLERFVRPTKLSAYHAFCDELRRRLAAGPIAARSGTQRLVGAIATRGLRSTVFAGLRQIFGRSA